MSVAGSFNLSSSQIYNLTVLGECLDAGKVKIRSSPTTTAVNGFNLSKVTRTFKARIPTSQTTSNFVKGKKCTSKTFKINRETSIITIEDPTNIHLLDISTFDETDHYSFVDFLFQDLDILEALISLLTVTSEKVAGLEGLCSKIQSLSITEESTSAQLLVRASYF
jgi:hypothetical protein